MSTSYRPWRPLRAEVHPLFSSSSKSTDYSQVAQASSPLWDRLRSSTPREGLEESKLAVAIEWPEDRRLGKGKERSLIIWVEQADAHDDVTSDYRLYVHPSLIPSFSMTPLSILLHLHEPTGLSLAILQPVLAHLDDNLPREEELHLSSLYGSSTPNGHTDHETLVPIIRQGNYLPSTAKYRVLLLEPVTQGCITPSTRIILSTEPYIPNDEGGVYEDDEIQSSYAKTHLSLSNFDPDAFLSSDLSLSLSVPQGEHFALNGEDALAKSISSNTSGSLTPRPGDRPPSPPAALDELVAEEVERGVKFAPIKAKGGEDDVCWLGVSGLGRAGIFEGDWVFLKPISNNAEASTSTSTNGKNGRLVKALAWEKLDDFDEDLPSNPILLPPSLHRSLLNTSDSTKSVIVQPTPFGARLPTLPTAKTVTLARIATSEGVDKRYERSWLKNLKRHFTTSKGKNKEDECRRLVRRGDIISIPVYPAKPLPADNTTGNNSDSDSELDLDVDEIEIKEDSLPKATGIVYFTVTSLSYDPLVPLEEDFRSSLSSKARSGELGCWVDVEEGTKMVLTGVEKERISRRDGDLVWHRLNSAPPPFSHAPTTKLRDLLKTCFVYPTLSYAVQLSILVKGARGSGKRSLIKNVASELGYNIVDVECYDIIGDSANVTSGSLLAKLEKAKLCSPSLLVLNHIEALAKKTESTVLGRPPAIVKVLEEIIKSAKATDYWPVMVVGTTLEADSVPNELLGCFKQDVEIKAPNENERLTILTHLLAGYTVAPDVDLTSIARQSAALHAGDIQSLIYSAYDISLKRISKSSISSNMANARLAGIQMTSFDLNQAINEARNEYSDSIGAPKIPNVTWEDVGGLSNVKQDILDTVQLPLQRGDLFGEGLKKRSGILLYGPPGTGKTLLAKAVATSCSLNFLSVKGPELLNMYIGESEANVRRLFQRARDASPCVIFMDELDSVAPKRGNQGDSGGVMDRIVSQLLAELDGMSSSSSGTSNQVFVLGATNRPDLLDPALLRPGRFDKMLYLSVPSTHQAQLDILKALTRKFTLHETLKLEDISERCELNYTGADLYALCADAMLIAMTRTAESIDRKIANINAKSDPNSNGEDADMMKTWKGDLTVQYYLAKIATQEEIEVKVTKEDFINALNKLIPSVSKHEMEHYERVQQEFKGFSIGKSAEPTADEADQDITRHGYAVNGVDAHRGESKNMGNGDRKGKGKARQIDGGAEEE
ncbi:uncharacterized protein IL334_007348 [Kwoniella shivajii]|uniref:Peroxisomal ATPase PEX6 n=1 Tax=Kwoniella shivajii TaxID=564305 RepID=A0ABZ1D8X6_9TREE|nr:hypothetical protein IL334_007348 [Kwoniella shivajii]